MYATCVLALQCLYNAFFGSTYKDWCNVDYKDEDFFIEPGFHALVSGPTDGNMQPDCAYEDGICFSIEAGVSCKIQAGLNGRWHRVDPDPIDDKGDEGDDEQHDGQCEIVRLSFEHFKWLRHIKSSRKHVFYVPRIAKVHGIRCFDGYIGLDDAFKGLRIER